MASEVWIAFVSGHIYAVYATREAAKENFAGRGELVWLDKETYSEAWAAGGVRCEVDKYAVNGGSNGGNS